MQLTLWCSQRVRAEAVPHKIVQVDAIPRTERGKVRRDAVRNMFLSMQQGKYDEGVEAGA
jgi:acyl-coenzyme A synthetase/AMP-(fatty) acid ligase